MKPLLLTLHVLFPNELLPALDLLDRRLVSKFVLKPQHQHQQHPSSEEEEEEEEADGGGEADVEGRGAREVYYVRSSSSSQQQQQQQEDPSSRFRSAAAGRGRTFDAFAKGYEVRLQGWNCTCPAFAFAWLGGMGNDDGDSGGGSEGEITWDGTGGRGHSFGGLMRGEGEAPVCKHLLACLLAESWRGFAGFVEERVVGREEMSGRAAGWGG